MKYILSFLLLGLLLSSCEDKIDISNKLKSGNPSLVVDAFLNNLPEKQVVKLTTTQFYFDNSAPKPATGASVSLLDLSSQQVYSFTETTPGNYNSPVNGDSLLKIGNHYQLSVAYNNQNYTATTFVNRIVPLDSITFEPAEKADGTPVEGSFDAEFWGVDAPGVGDRYWVRHYKNGVRNTNASNIGIGYDASAFPTGETDGMEFIFPLRRFFINEQELEDKWKVGDTIVVEMYSITDETAFFLQQVVSQSSLGSGGAIGALFSTPPSNVPTNIVNTDKNGAQAVGFFSTSAVSWGKTITPNKGIRKP